MPENKTQGSTAFGIIMEALPNATFRVLLENDREIMAHLAGKMRLYRIKVIIGNKVRVELNPYDKNKGKIIQRL